MLGKGYEVVNAFGPKMHPSRMPLAISTVLECHTFGIMLTAMDNGKGDIASCFVKDIGLALAPTMCSDQSQAFKEVNNSQAFP